MHTSLFVALYLPKFLLMIIVSRRLVNVLSFNFASAMAFFPFILLQKASLRENVIMMNHERIHLRQQLELMVVLFYALYVVEYLVGRLKGQTHYQSYKNISFEKEAYENEHDLSYLKNKKIFSFRFYILQKTIKKPF